MTTQFPGTRQRQSAPAAAPTAQQAARKAMHDKLVFDFGGKYNNFNGWVNVKGGCVNLDTLEFTPPSGMTVEQFKSALGY